MVDPFLPNNQDFFKRKSSSIVYRLKKQFNNLLDRIGNYYVYRHMLDIPADKVDKLTKESLTLNNYQFENIVIKSFTNQSKDTDAFEQILDLGIVDINSKLFYIKPDIIEPKINDYIFNIDFKDFSTNLDNIDPNIISEVFKITHITPYKISNSIIYYAIYTKEIQ